MNPAMVLGIRFLSYCPDRPAKFPINSAITKAEREVGRAAREARNRKGTHRNGPSACVLIDFTSSFYLSISERLINDVLKRLPGPNHGNRQYTGMSCLRPPFDLH